MPPCRKSLLLLFLILVLTCCASPVSAQAQSWCGIQTLFFQHNLSTSPAGYEELINYPSGNPEVDENITINAGMGPVLLDAYITPEGALTDTSELLKGLRITLKDLGEVKLP